MIEHLRVEWKNPVEQADCAAGERSRLLLSWRLDPVTGKPTSRWVREAPQAGASGELATAA
jgi:hypothetical protein